MIEFQSDGSQILEKDIPDEQKAGKELIKILKRLIYILKK